MPARTPTAKLTVNSYIACCMDSKNMIKFLLSTMFIYSMLVACQNTTSTEPTDQSPQLPDMEKQKIVIYQVFTRLFGNTKSNNIPWGSLEENGVGKFHHFTDKALQEIKDLGITHIWFTGVPHHAVITDYSDYGISNDDPDVVKGRAGSPYAVKDYYNVNPDLAEDPARRLQEFLELIKRSHAQGLKVLIDIVPNHVARGYEGKTNPPGIKDFGAQDDTSVTYRRNNNFYYNPHENFKVPMALDGYLPLGGEPHPLADGYYREVPSKWTGNGSRLSQPHFHDWYETVKINYGIQPDGTKDFVSLPDGFHRQGYEQHLEFWKTQEVPDSWKKFKDITQYWLKLGVDGFRFDMAELVPVEFWSYLNSQIKSKNDQALLLAEVYNPKLYRDYIQLGKMDYLYDKVELYDTLKHIIQGNGSTDNIPTILEGLADIEHHMLHFLENHDEQRIASPQFAGNAQYAKPAMVLSATISTSPTMIYFGQEVGEPGAEDAGFGKPSRTSIFDYIGVPHHQRWVNNLKFDGGQLSPEEKELRDFYRRLLNFTLINTALLGEYREVHQYNRVQTKGYSDQVYAYLRFKGEEKLLVICNFSPSQSQQFDLLLPPDIIATLNIRDGKTSITDQLYGERTFELDVVDNLGKIPVGLQPLESLLLEIN